MIATDKVSTKRKGSPLRGRGEPNIKWVNVMTIDKIFGDKGVGPVDGIKKARKIETPKEQAGSPPKDKVEFSAVLQEVNRAREAAGMTGSSRAEKIEALKAQIASGNYRPDPEKVAESLLRFLAGNK